MTAVVQAAAGTTIGVGVFGGLVVLPGWHPWRHVPQRLVHPVQGAPSDFASLPQHTALRCRPRHLIERGDGGCITDAGGQYNDGQGTDGRDQAPTDEAQAGAFQGEGPDDGASWRGSGIKRSEEQAAGDK